MVEEVYFLLLIVACLLEHFLLYVQLSMKTTVRMSLHKTTNNEHCSNYLHPFFIDAFVVELFLF